MTTATVVAKQSENFGRFPAASCSSSSGSASTTASTVAAPGTQLRMNDTHQPQPLHTSDTSPRDQTTNGTTSTGGGLAVVLSACSPYFRKLLKANPCEHPIVILRDVRSEDIENLLRFMYNGEVHIGQDQLSDFLKTAQLLQVRGLADVTTGNPTGGRTSANSSMLNSSLSTPAVQELKASPTSTSLPWELPDDNNPAPPPQKRTKSSELYRKQHGLSPDDPIPLDLLPVGQHPLTRERDRSKDKSKDHHHRGSSEHDLHHHHHHRERDRSLELRESLLGQALEGGPTLTVPSKHPDLLSLQAAASGEDSNSSDTAASDHGDDIEGLNGNIEHTRPSFPFLGLQGIPGLIPGPSGMHGDNFGECLISMFFFSLFLSLSLLSPSFPTYIYIYIYATLFLIFHPLRLFVFLVPSNSRVSSELTIPLIRLKLLLILLPLPIIRLLGRVLN
uniref:BTB domain-containing protein n=1 Tax=Anopheles maculatus TaxID=74869 RepID=A0A182SRV1_9DIPT